MADAQETIDAHRIAAAAMINARVACALATLAGMQVANHERQDQDLAMAYDEDAFLGVAKAEGIDQDSVQEALYW